MRFISKNDIELWSKSYNAKGDLPALISRLVKGSTPQSTTTDFPSGSAVFGDGYDGIVVCGVSTAFVPEGKSVWEFGTTKGSVTKKAEEDYLKRTNEPLGKIPKDCTFVFLTPSYWRDKGKWQKLKQAENKWKSVLVYDSRNLEEWLDSSVVTSRWFAGHIGKVQADGTQTIEEFWDGWAHGPFYKLEPGLITCGRKNEVENLLSFLKGPEGILGIKASTKNEAIAFVIAAAKEFEESESERFFSKSLIIENEPHYRVVASNYKTLNLIPKFQDNSAIHFGVSKGHHVIVPLGPDDDFNLDPIILPLLDRDGQIQVLITMGITREQAEHFVHESAHNITFIKRFLKFPSNRNKWMEKCDVREILPALLLGRWNENNKGDQNILEKFSGLAYDEYSLILQRWQNLEDSPLIKIGDTWRLASPLNAWNDFSEKLQTKDFSHLKESFLEAFRNGNPEVDFDDEEKNKYSTKHRLYSGWARKGLTQSLILIGLFGKNLAISKIQNTQDWVDGIISQLLINADGNLWISFNQEMPLIAEASPNSFLEALEGSISTVANPVLKMFNEVDGITGPESHHTGLLWALESLAWLPDYFYGSTLNLLRLSRMDPGGRLSNRPINSLVEIFKPWHYQTLVGFNDRMQILEKIAQHESEAGWSLLNRLLPDKMGIAHPTHKPRWRLFNIPAIPYTYNEANLTYSFVIKVILNNRTLKASQIAELVESSIELAQADRENVLQYIDDIALVDDNQVVWDVLRKILSKHRAVSHAPWALSENELMRYETIYKKIEPAELLDRYLWLFNEHWPQSPYFPRKAKRENRNLEDEQNEIDTSRSDAVEKIVEHYGIQKVVEISSTVQYPWQLGFALANSLPNDHTTEMVVDELNKDKNDNFFVQGYVYRYCNLKGIEWAFDVFGKYQRKEKPLNNLAQIFAPLNQNLPLWERINQLPDEVRRGYWKSMQPHFYQLSIEEKIIGLTHLLDSERYRTALNTAGQIHKELPSSLLASVLFNAGTKKSEENTRLDAYSISEIFSTLHTRLDIGRKELINLEWIFLSVLSDYGSRKKPKILHEELANNPEFFTSILNYVFKGNETAETENAEITDEIRKTRATQGYHLLHSWKTIPGMDEKGKIDEDKLNSWVDQVREIAKKTDRLAVADMQIGTVLAQYPETSGTPYPPEPIGRLMERINSKSLFNNYSSALYNKRGFSSRGVFDGGNIERGHAQFFQSLAQANRINFPKISKIFSQLANGYLIAAKREDESAEREKLEY